MAITGVESENVFALWLWLFSGVTSITSVLLHEWHFTTCCLVYSVQTYFFFPYPGQTNEQRWLCAVWLLFSVTMNCCSFSFFFFPLLPSKIIREAKAGAKNMWGLVLMNLSKSLKLGGKDPSLIFCCLVAGIFHLPYTSCAYPLGPCLKAWMKTTIKSW